MITLAIALEEALGVQTRSLVCLADRDTDIYLGFSHECSYLLFTDYTCIEMYLLEPSVLDKFLQLYVRGLALKAEELIASLVTVLEELFLIRLTNQLLGLGLKHLSFEKACSYSNGAIEFRTEDYIYKYLNSNARLAEMKRFNDTMNDLRLMRRSEAREQVHGHDFLDLFCWYIGEALRDRQSYRSATVSRCLMLCLDHSRLLRYSVFRQLLAVIPN